MLVEQIRCVHLLSGLLDRVHTIRKRKIHQDIMIRRVRSVLRQILNTVSRLSGYLRVQFSLMPVIYGF